MTAPTLAHLLNPSLRAAYRRYLLTCENAPGHYGDDTPPEPRLCLDCGLGHDGPCPPREEPMPAPIPLRPSSVPARKEAAMLDRGAILCWHDWSPPACKLMGLVQTCRRCGAQRRYEAVSW